MKKKRFTNFADRLDKASEKKKKPIVFPEEEAEFNKLEFFWDHCQPQDSANLDIWSKTLRKMEAEKESIPVATSRKLKIGVFLKISAVAAMIALLVGIGFLWQHEEHSDLKEIAQAFEKMNQGMDEQAEVTLVLSDEQKIELTGDEKIAYSSEGEVSVDSEKVIAKQTVAYNQIIVPKGKRSQIVLSDNSKVWINSGSRVVYPRQFEGESREIFVEGEVYLEVTRDEGHPFIVNTAGFEVRVLGTAFNVSAYRATNQSSVVLVNGSVEVKDSRKQVLKIKPNECALIRGAEIVEKQAVNAQEYISWVEGLFIFDGERLEDVLRKVGNYYGMDIICDSSVSTEQVYGKLDLKEHLLDVLKSLEEILPIKITEKEQKIYVTRE